MDMEDVVAEADLADPNPDVEDLFQHYDRLYFRGALADAGFVVKWASPDRSFGSCTFSRPRNTIALSEPVLQYRSCTDRKNALLHYMIHAIIHVKHHKKDNSYHGPLFRAWMDAINSCSIKDHQRPDDGYNITTRHDFSPEEPHNLKGILWKCESCGDTLLRATKQGPPSDACCIENVNSGASCGNMLCHWHNHKNDCCGTYEKPMLESDSPSQKKVPGGAQLLLTCPLEMSKSKGAIKECGSSALQGNTRTTKPNAEDKHLSLVSGSNGKPPGSSSSKKAGKRRRSEVVMETSIVLAESSRKAKEEQGIAKEDDLLFLVNGTFAKSPRTRNQSKKVLAAKQHKSEDVQKPSGLPASPKGKQKDELSSEKGCNDAKSPERNTSKKAGEQHEPQITHTVCSQPAYSQERLKQDTVAPEKKELSPAMCCSNEKLMDKRSSKRAHRQPEDFRMTTVLPAAPGSKPKAGCFVVSKKQRKEKLKTKPSREKEYVVMSLWMGYYESDRSSGSTEPLVNKRTERRRRERERGRGRERIQTYSRSKKINSSRTDASISSHKMKLLPCKDEPMEQCWPPAPCSDTAVPITANQVVVTPATRGDHSQPSAPCMDIAPLKPADPTSFTPPDIIDISDDD